MKVYKKKDKIIIEIPCWQNSYDAIGEKRGKVSNVIGMICGEEQGLAQVIDLGYKGSFDYGDFIIRTYLDRDDFMKLCKKLDIEFFEYPICADCKKPIYGCYSINNKGRDICLDCKEKHGSKKH